MSITMRGLGGTLASSNNTALIVGMGCSALHLAQYHVLVAEGPAPTTLPTPRRRLTFPCAVLVGRRSPPGRAVPALTRWVAICKLGDVRVRTDAMWPRLYVYKFHEIGII